MTSKRQQKAGWLIPDTIETEEVMNICVTIPYTDEYRDAFFGAIGELKKWWNWNKSYTPGDERAKDTAQLFRDVMTYSIVDSCEGGGDVPAIFREKPGDPCEVQYSNDEGLNWFTMFRKDNCIGVGGGYTGVQTNIDITNIENNLTIYAGDIINLAPKWTYTPGITDVALCHAIKKYVDILCDFHLSQLRDNSDLLTISYFAEQASKLLIAAGVGLAAATGQVAVAAFGAAAYALAEIGFDIINESLSNNREYYEDAAARELVACWMIEKIKGAAPQFTEWSISLDDFRSDAPEATAIAAIVGVANKDENVYMNFLLAMQDLNDVSASLPVCECPEPIIIDQLSGETRIDFYGNLYTNPTSHAIANPGDVPVVGAGIYSIPNDLYSSVPGSTGGVACNIRVNLPADHLVTNVRIGWGADRVSVFGGGDKNAAVWLGDEANPMGTYIAGRSWDTGTYSYRWIITSATNLTGFTATPQPYMYVHNSSNSGANYCDIWWIHIELIPYIP